MVVRFGNWSLGFGSDMGVLNKGPLALIILDGWGYSSVRDGNAIALAHTPNYDRICADFPRTLLAASGERVGLSANAPGNSEIGHLTIGTGRVVRSPFGRIREAIGQDEFSRNRVLKDAFLRAAETSADVHLVGLISDAEIHSSVESLFALLRFAKKEGFRENVFVHCILDGRDVGPRTADIYLEMLSIKLADIGVGQIATVCGRHFAMDKGQNWERTVRAFTLLVHSEGETARDPVEAVHGSYLRGISDEFIQPVVIEKTSGEPVAAIGDGDLVIFFNHRGDRMRQFVRSIAVRDSTDVALGKPSVEAVCLTEYDSAFDLPVAFPSGNEQNGLAEIFAQNGVYNCRLSESEKATHVTSFFNGGDGTGHPCEQRLFTPTPGEGKEETPEMGCFKITDNLLRGLEAGENEVFIVNLAAADLVAHTGNLDRTIEAVQFVDTCLGGIVEKIREMKGIAVITADHGNCEEMADTQSPSPNTSHTSNPVPFHLIAPDIDGLRLRANGALEDVAPTILGILGIEKPDEMTGSDLRLV